MKKILFMLSGIVLIFLTSAKLPESDSETENKDGISFHQGTWDEALLLAKKRGNQFFWTFRPAGAVLVKD